MFERFTFGARSAVVQAQEAARRLGHDVIGTDDVLIGIASVADGIGAKVLAGRGVTAGDLTRRVAVLRPPTSPEPIVGHIVFAEDAKEVMAEALRRSLELRHRTIDSGHLLLGCLTVDGAAGRLLAEAGVDAVSLRADVLERRPIGVDPGPEPPFAAELLGGWDKTWAGPPARLPKRAGIVRGLTALAMAYALIGVLVVKWATPGFDAQFSTFVLVFFPLVGAVGHAAKASKPISLKKIMVVNGGRLLAPDPVPALLATRYGRPIHTELLIEAVKVRSRAVRRGSNAIIVIAGRNATDPKARRFVAVHELAHLLRDDSMLYVQLYVAAVGLAEAAVMSGTAKSASVALLGGLLLWVAGRWTAELACDGLAARWTGEECATAWFDRRTALLKEPQNRTLRRRLKRGAIGWLTHPPRWLRRIWTTRQARRGSGD